MVPAVSLSPPLCCEGQFRHEPSEYGVAVHLGLVESQEKECARMLVEMFKRGPNYLKERGFVNGDEVERAHSTERR